jgi:hypothetical protein
MKKYIAIILLALTIAESGCRKDFLSLETNPNSPSTSSPDLALAGALKTTAAIVNGTGYTMYASWMGYLSWSTSYQPNTALENYSITTSTYDLFTPIYINLSNYNALIASNPGPNFTAIAKIMEVYNFEALVDNYGSVPYSQAFGGATLLTPKYDDAAGIYDDLMVQLDASIKMIQGAKATDVTPGTGDIMFGGNMGTWILFANTLKLKLALRESTAAVAHPSTVPHFAVMQAAVVATASLGYLGTAGTTALVNGSSLPLTSVPTVGATVNPGYLNSDANGGQQSPMYLAYGVSAGGAGLGNSITYQAGAYGTHSFAVLNDPRLDFVYTATSTPNAANATGTVNASVDSVSFNSHYVVVGTTFGTVNPPQGIVPPATKLANLAPSKFGSGVLKSPTQNANVLSLAESYFLQAEGAAATGYGVTGTAATLYNKGIAASFTDDAVTGAAAAAATYSAQPSVAYPSAGTFAQQQQAIITQKYLALNLYGAFEAFNDLRRTGYPNNIPLSAYPGNTAPNQITRIPYPFVEYANNANNVPSAGSINIFSTKIFWAK